LAHIGFKPCLAALVVERTFGWLNRYRRRSHDYEKLPDTSENMVYISLIDIMLKRLTKNQDAMESGP
jgi:putative transposase